MELTRYYLGLSKYRKLDGSGTYPDPRNIVSTGVVSGAGRSSVRRRPHPIPIVLTDENGGEIPEFGHVIGLHK